MDGWMVLVFLGWVCAALAFLVHLRGSSSGLETKRRAKYERVP